MRGIGPAMAKRIVAAFGEATFEIIEAAPERLTEVAGIGPVAGVSHRGGLGRAEGRAGDHDLPARARGRDGPSGSHLQDLRPRSHQGHDRGPVPAGARRARDRVPDGGRHCGEARGGEDRAPAAAGRGVVCASDGDGRGPLRPADRDAGHLGREAAGGGCRPDPNRRRRGATARRGRARRHGGWRALRLPQGPAWGRAGHRRAADRARSQATPPWPEIDLDKALPWVEQKTGKTLSRLAARGRAACARLQGGRDHGRTGRGQDHQRSIRSCAS